MNIFFLCLDNYPINGACSNLLNNVFVYSDLKNNFDIHVVTFKNDIAQPANEEIDGIFIHRINLYSWYDIHKISKKKLLFYKVLFFKMVDKTVQLLFPSFFYNKLQEISLLKFLASIKQIDTLVSVAGYFSTCAAAARYKALHNETKFIIYQVDPCSTNETLNSKYSEIRHAFEINIYKKADGVITTDIIIEEQMKMGGLCFKNKFFLCGFPNIVIREISKKDEIEKIFPLEEKVDRVYCTFAGRMYAGRNIQYIIDLFSKLSDYHFTLLLVGVEKEQVPYCPSNVFCLGVQPINVTRRILSCSDFLINIGNSMNNQVPSKLFEYFSYCKPIINICQIDSCPSLKYTTRYPLAINIFQNAWSINQASEMIKNFVLKNRNKVVDADFVVREFKESTPQYFADCINEIVEGEE